MSLNVEQYKGMSQSVKDDWGTPQAFFDDLNAEFGFALDPCATPISAKCPRYFTRDDDGLAQSWAPGPVFMNPPYGTVIRQWVRKAAEEARNGVTVVGLVPARVETGWFHDFVLGERAEVRYLRGRLQFESDAAKKGHNAPFPSIVVVWRGHRPLRELRN